MINLHIVRGIVRNDSRVLKEAATLQASGMFSSVEIVGLNEAGLPTEETIAGLPVRRIDLATRGWSKGLPAQALKFAEWRRRILQMYAGRSVAVVHCHDIDPLPIGLRLRDLDGARVVYDAHELQTEQGEASRLRVALYKWYERRAVGRVDAMITVSDGIADWYRTNYGIPRPALVRNVPPRPSTPLEPVDLRGALGVPAESLLFVYLGALLPHRGIEQLLEAFQMSGVRHHLVCIGFGPLSDLVRAAAARQARIHYHEAVAPDAVLRHAAGGDVGVSMTIDMCLSQRFSLPNKVFECMIAGLPLLVCDLPEQRRLVERFRAGWVTSTDAGSIAEVLRAIDPRRCAAVRAGLAQRTAELGWHAEAEVLIDVYRKVLEGTH